MAVGTAYSSVNMDTAYIWYGYVTVANNNLIQISANGYVQNYYGNFYYNSYGNLAGGKVSLTSYYEYGSKIYDISGGTYNDALAIKDYVDSGGRMYNLFNYVFSGDDTLNGSSGNDLIEGFTGNDKIYGNNGNDTLNAGDGNDLLDGGFGSDLLNGWNGNDIYIIDNVSDKIIETNTGGIDTANSYVSHTLESNVENLNLIGFSAINAIGNYSNNILVGNSNSNILIGGLGFDTLTGGIGKDIFRILDFSKDTIKDFSVLDDTIQLENSVFTKLLVTGTLNSSYFRIGSYSLDSNDYITYNKTTGAVYYDNDGNGINKPIQILTLGLNLTLTNADFIVI